jgi:hypothetical protein
VFTLQILKANIKEKQLGKSCINAAKGLATKGLIYLQPSTIITYDLNSMIQRIMQSE